MFRVFFSFLVLVRSQFVPVDLTIGTVVGIKNKGYNAFFGVPYARVDPACPFGKPKNFPNFTEPFEAVNPSVRCPQTHNVEGVTLQCLRLNIYVPQTFNQRRAILVWFPSYFHRGCAGDYGGEHLVKEDIIVVVANFRLGVYGFSCLDQPYIPANMALRDQDAALRWVKDNIDKFGGDPHSVTIGGQGYGGGFADIHMYSNLDKLYDKVIMQSGSIFARGFFGRSNPGAVINLAKRLGKPVGSRTTAQDVLPFLAKIDPVKVINVSKSLKIKSHICKEKRYRFGLKNFINKSPYYLNNLDKIKGTKILVGYNSMELLGEFIENNNNTKEFYDGLANIFYERLSQAFELPDKDKRELAKRMRKFYIGGQDIGPETTIKLIESGSDLYVNHPIEMSINRLIQAGATVYKYLFSYTGGSIYKRTKGAGATNEEELKYLFEMDTKIKGGAQQKIRRTLITLWANFVKYGNPSPRGTPVWPQVKGDNRPYVEVGGRLTLKDHVFHERMAFLDLLFYSYRKNVISQTGDDVLNQE